jgi:hypothetical protein
MEGEREEEERKRVYADLLLQVVRRHTLLPSNVMKSVLRYAHSLFHQTNGTIGGQIDFLHAHTAVCPPQLLLFFICKTDVGTKITEMCVMDLLGAIWVICFAALLLLPNPRVSIQP